MRNKIVKKIDYLLDLADRFEASAEPSTADMGFGEFATTKYNVELYAELKNSTKSLVLKLYGNEHPYYTDLNKSLTNFGGAKNSKGILTAIKLEIQDGFILSIRDLLSAEIFTDFIEMAEYLLKEKYKDPAAVIIGSVLENRLRLLMSANDIDILDNKGKPKKASSLNDELYKADIYGKLDQKSIVAWLDLRNQAAHGHYDQYNQQQVEMMLNYVRDFVNRVRL
ncbi:hypothetical protein [Olleya sp. Bg11-27]|uniref:hypothetical protein n=1 Tax=Olleya sp. Bg11-27 TaxID=2058135 RepID=UPI000C3021F5|nr:hypothetical protein [Olleya sp. Bg11-27]AUC76878.1 hypothetical protein CW732_14825 [Olleya sp. Bg11-27]